MKKEKYHYVYKLYDEFTGEYYYGVRSSDVHPKNDSYMGSMVTWKVDVSKLKKEIVGICNSREEAVQLEKLLIKSNSYSCLNRNFTDGKVSHKKEKIEFDARKIFDFSAEIWKDIVY